MNRLFVIILIIVLVFSFYQNYLRGSVSNLPEEQYIDKILAEKGFSKANAQTAFQARVGEFYQPIKNFYRNQTVNMFGTLVSGRFYGFHTGVDVEIDPSDLDKDVPVRAIYNGAVEEVQNVTGYGGVVAIRHEIGPKQYVAVYGHLRLKDIKVRSNQKVYSGDLIGYLGAAYSEETDGERKHLHFGLHKGLVSDIRGYVDTKNELESWVDPTEFLRELDAKKVN